MKTLCHNVGKVLRWYVDKYGYSKGLVWTANALRRSVKSKPFGRHERDINDSLFPRKLLLEIHRYDPEPFISDAKPALDVTAPTPFYETLINLYTIGRKLGNIVPHYATYHAGALPGSSIDHLPFVVINNQHFQPFDPLTLPAESYSDYTLLSLTGTNGISVTPDIRIISGLVVLRLLQSLIVDTFMGS